MDYTCAVRVATVKAGMSYCKDPFKTDGLNTSLDVDMELFCCCDMAYGGHVSPD